MTNRKTLLGVLCFLAAFQPQCTRTCPKGFLDLGCDCKWDWEDCPPPPSCGSSSSALVASGDAGMLVVVAPRDAALLAPRVDEPPGGTLAFAQTEVGTFVVAAIAELDLVRVIRVDVSDEGVMRAHVLGDVAFGRDRQPERVIVDDRGFAHVVLRGSGEIATFDPARLAVVSRWRSCASPRDIAYDHMGNTLVVACDSGDVVTLDATTGEETKRTFVDRGLRHVAMDGSAIVASTRARLFVMGADGTFATHDDNRPLVAFGTRGSDVVIAHDDGLELAPVDGSAGRALDGASNAVSDVQVGDDGMIVVAANGNAFVLPAGAPAFTRLPTTGFVTSVGVAREGELTLLGFQTAEATVELTSLASTSDLVVLE